MKIEVLSEGEDVVLGYKRFTFSDGQPHIILDRAVYKAIVGITISLTSLEELFDLLLVRDVLQRKGNVIHLEIRYLLGARMDRAIDRCQPFTLKVITDMLQGFGSVKILDPHSQVAVSLLDADPLYPFVEVRKLLSGMDPMKTCIIIPDLGARDRVRALMGSSGYGRGDSHFTQVQCSKNRDVQTGKLTGFTIHDPTLVREGCFIVDDICDGGGTFVGLAAELRKAGAKSIALFVTHGIFSKGRKLPGIDFVYSTDSFTPRQEEDFTFAQCEKIGGHCWEPTEFSLTQASKYVCRHCGGTRWGTPQEPIKWSEPRPRVGDPSRKVGD